ncbi:MAG TPA: hypothetical protein VGD42_17950 [Lysobacter sp.]
MSNRKPPAGTPAPPRRRTPPRIVRPLRDEPRKLTRADRAEHQLRLRRLSAGYA